MEREEPRFAVCLVTEEQEGGVNGTGEEGVIACCAGWERGFEPGCESEGVGVDLEAKFEREGEEPGRHGHRCQCLLWYLRKSRVVHCH